MADEINNNIGPETPAVDANVEAAAEAAAAEAEVRLGPGLRRAGKRRNRRERLLSRRDFFAHMTKKYKNGGCFCRVFINKLLS